MRREIRSYDLVLGFALLAFLALLLVLAARYAAPVRPTPPEITKVGDVPSGLAIQGVRIDPDLRTAIKADIYRDGLNTVPGQLLLTGKPEQLANVLDSEVFAGATAVTVIGDDDSAFVTQLFILPDGGNISEARNYAETQGDVEAALNYLHAAPWDIGAEPWDIGAEPWDIGAEPWDIGAEPWDIGAEEAAPGELLVLSCTAERNFVRNEPRRLHTLPWQQWALLDDTSSRQGIDLYAANSGERLVSATGQGVHVIILDTAPFEQAGEYEISGLTQNLLVQLPDTVLTTKSSVPPALPRENKGNTNEHGLFVAALVNYVAPDASLELVRVLNDDGVGDMATLMAALHEIGARDNLQNTVINLSLSLRMEQTLAGAFGSNSLRSADSVPAVVEGVGEDAEELVRLQAELQALQDAGAIIVAAAGNDSLVTNVLAGLTAPEDQVDVLGKDPPLLGSLTVDTPDSIYLGNVVSRWGQAVGVAGHDNNAIASCFSNQFAPGQEVDRQSAQQVQQSEVEQAADSLLVYAPAGDGGARLDGEETLTCENRLPSCPKDCGASSYDCQHGLTSLTTRGYAYWAGTSFAAPLVTGMVALVRQENGDPPQDVQQCVIGYFNSERDFDVERLLAACGAATGATSD